MTSLALDAGALIALERRDRRIATLLAHAVAESADIIVPATVLAQVVRTPRTQVELMRLLRGSSTRVAQLSQESATAVGRLLARAGTSDIADAHVAITAQANHAVVVTSDAADLHHLDPELSLVAI